MTLEERVSRLEGASGQARNGAEGPDARPACRVSATFTVDISREDGMYVSRAREINVASFGESREEAAANIREAIELYFEDPPGAMPQFQVDTVEVVVASP